MKPKHLTPPYRIDTVRDIRLMRNLYEIRDGNELLVATCENRSIANGIVEALEPTTDYLTFKELREAAALRNKEWGTEGSTISFAANELAGEVGEALEVAVAGLLLSIAGGKASNMVKKLDRAALGIVGGTDAKEVMANLEDEIGDVIICADRLLMLMGGPELGIPTARKFNKTSDKHGFKTRMRSNEVNQTSTKHVKIG